MLALGVALAAAGFVVGGRRVRRTRYRPDPWGVPEWCTALSGVATAAVVIAVGAHDASALNPSIFPLAWPALPAIPTIAILSALLPAALTPPPPITAAPAPRSPSRQPAGANA